MFNQAILAERKPTVSILLQRFGSPVTVHLHISDVIRYLIGIISDFHIAHTMFREVRSLTSGYNFSYPKSKHEKLHNQVWQACSDTFPLISYRT